MHLKAVILENFRRYKERTLIPIENLTAFIGRNDSGKSTILEALEIFFEGDTVKIEPGDACASGDAKNVCIGAIFNNIPERLDLDSGAHTTLQTEHLLNSSEELEILKVYNCKTQKVSPPKVFARAMHPMADDLKDLLQKSNSDLKNLVERKGVESKCHRNRNPSMRKALYNTVSDLRLTETDVPLNNGDAKNVWESIKRHLPVYVLFCSDRVSTDQDDEVQNPMKMAIKAALSNLAKELDDITLKVKKVAEETASRTLEHLRTSYPNLELASVLKPNFHKPNWANIFKLNLESDDHIPLNKRGSGIRRLVLLSFFQAEASRMQKERQSREHTGVPVIYAIEEPETSQHPDSQEKIIQAFCKLSESGEQVILTTHVPGLAGLLPLSSLRFVDTNPETSQVRVRSGTKDVFSEVAETLGILPEATDKSDVKVAVAVEGPTDIDALVSFATVLTKSGDLINFDQSKVFWTIGGGTTLKDWVEHRYLDKLGIPQIYLFDSDRTSSELPPSKSTEDQVKEINARSNCKGFLSHKRTIENYVHPDAISRVSDGKITLPSGIDMDYGDITQEFKSAFDEAKSTYKSLDFNPKDHADKSIKNAKCKKIITAYVMRNMTADEIKDRGAYKNSSGIMGNEVLEWLSAIQEHL